MQSTHPESEVTTGTHLMVFKPLSRRLETQNTFYREKVDLHTGRKVSHKFQRRSPAYRARKSWREKWKEMYPHLAHF